MSYSLQPYGLYPARFLCPWDSPVMNTAMRHHVLLQGIFSTQKLGLRLHWPSISLVPSGKLYIVSEFPTIFSLKKETELLLWWKKKRKKTLFIILIHIYLNKTLVYKAPLMWGFGLTLVLIMMLCYDATKSSQSIQTM